MDVGQTFAGTAGQQARKHALAAARGLQGMCRGPVVSDDGVAVRPGPEGV